MGPGPGSPGRSCYSRMSSVSPKRLPIAASLDQDPVAAMAAIPERDRRLITVLMMKRHQDREHSDLVDRFHRLWSQEKEEREMRESAATDTYKRYISGQRQRERWRRDEQRLLATAEQQTRRGRLLDTIADKERRAAELLAWKDDRKHSELAQRSTEQQSRRALAAWRRALDDAAAEERRALAAACARHREDQADRRRMEMLTEVSQKVAYSNALSSWGSAHVRRRRRELDALRTASAAVRVAATEAKAARIQMAKSRRQDQARKLADFTALLRDAIRE